jgi:hypothetical protein
MAALDWLFSDIGGQSQTVNDPGGLGVHPSVGSTGVTWGQLLQAATAGGQGQSSLPFGNGNFAYAPPKQNIQMYNIVPQSMQGSQQQQGDDWSSIMSILMKAFGGGGS